MIPRGKIIQTQKPLEIVERMIKASSPPDGIVLDPFMGTGTTAEACWKLKRNYIGFEINADYCRIIEQRLERLREVGSLFEY